MRFWVREIAGWVLVGLGLCIFMQCFWWLSGGRYIGAGSWTLVGFFVFRGGIHLLKVAVAARVCMEANDRLQSEAPARPSPRRVSGPAATVSRPPWGP
jgi:hypothetical protein